MTDRKLPSTASVATQTGDGKLHAPAAERNAATISALLQRVAPSTGVALELASGTGQHVVTFARDMPALTWQPTEVSSERLASIDAYCHEADLGNLRSAHDLNACTPGWGEAQSADLIVLINLLHLISTREARILVSEVARALNPGGRFVLYGPFKRDGVLTSEGDHRFHASLQGSDPEIGYKDDGDVARWLQDSGLTEVEIAELPANNLAFVFSKPD